LFNNLVSIIIPCYNAEEFISETIDSVLAQTYENWEMIIVDDCSIDNSPQIILSSTNKDERIRLIKLSKNSGVAEARNMGLLQAKGDYIAFLDSDDIWDKNKLHEQIKFMKHNDILLSYTSYIKINEDGEKIGRADIPKSVDYKKMLKSNYIACSSAMAKKDTLNGLLFPPLRLRQDHAFWLSILKDGIKAYGIREPLLHYRVRKRSLSSNKFIAVQYQWKLYREIEKLPLYKSIWYFLNYAYLGFKKHLF